MEKTDIYKDIYTRTNGAVMLGVVGPVRTGKSTFIKHFMETLVIPNIEDVYARERAKDELPQSGSGRTIMTSEPKFVPEEAVNISVDEGINLSVRLVDCVGYMVNGASGLLDDGTERMVTTPWFDHEVSMTEAAEEGTYKVINDHSTIGLVVTTDGTICDIPRESYIEPEERVISELISIGKPFAVLLNSAEPDGEKAIEIARQIEEKYNVPCIRLNCQWLTDKDITDIMSKVLGQFPASELAIWLPGWFEKLGDDFEEKRDLYNLMAELSGDIEKISDVSSFLDLLNELETVKNAYIKTSDMGSGVINIGIDMPDTMYYDIISRETGFEISDDGELLTELIELSKMKREYDRVKPALEDVKEKGYGVVLPSQEELNIEEPKIVKQGGKYAVKLKASAPAIHMLKTGVVTEVSPAVGGEGASEEIISFLLQGYDGDMTKLWESNIFGKPLYDIAKEGIEAKLAAMPDNARVKLQETLQRIINEGSGMLICILL